MEEIISKNHFSELALKNLRLETTSFFESWKDFEIIDTLFFQDESENIKATPIVRTKGDSTHKITLLFHEKSESWSYIPNTLSHFSK